MSTSTRKISSIDENGHVEGPKSTRSTQRIFRSRSPRDNTFVIVADENGEWDFNGTRVSLLSINGAGETRWTVSVSSAERTQGAGYCDGDEHADAAEYFGLVPFIAPEQPELVLEESRTASTQDAEDVEAQVKIADEVISELIEEERVEASKDAPTAPEGESVTEKLEAMDPLAREILNGSALDALSHLPGELNAETLYEEKARVRYVAPTPEPTEDATSEVITETPVEDGSKELDPAAVTE